MPLKFLTETLVVLSLRTSVQAFRMQSTEKLACLAKYLDCCLNDFPKVASNSFCQANRNRIPNLGILWGFSVENAFSRVTGPA